MGLRGKDGSAMVKWQWARWGKMPNSAPISYGPYGLNVFWLFRGLGQNCYIVFDYVN